MTKLDEIKYVDWQFKLNDIGDVAEGVEDINQCIAIILNTPKGTDPHRPTFGSNIYKYVDYPINVAKPNIIRETIDSISLWETRISINKTSVEINGSTITIKIEWTLKSGKTSGTAEVVL